MSEIFPVFFKSCIKVSIGSSYIKFVAVDAYQFINPLSVVFVEHLENNHRKINTLEETEIVKVATTKYLLNEVIAGQNDPVYKLPPSPVILTPR